MSHSKQAIYNTVGVITSSFCQWLIIMVLPKISNYSEAGVFAASVSVCSILNMIAISLYQYQISDQYRKYGEDDYRVARIITVIVSFVFIIPFVVVLNYDTEQSLAIVAYMCFRNLLHIAYLYTVTLQFKDKLDYVGICTVVEGIISFTSFVIAYCCTSNLVLSILVMAIFGGGFFLVLIIRGYIKYVEENRWYSLKYDPSNVKKLLLIAVPLLLATLSPLIITAMPKLILQYYWGDDQLGIFSTLSSPTIVIPLIVSSAFVPFITIFSNAVKDGNFTSVKRNYLKLVGLLFVFGGMLLLVSFLLAKILFGLIYGSDFDNYIGYFHILVIGVVFYSIGSCGTTVLITKDQGKISAYASFLVLIISAIVFFMMIPDDGISGASYGLLIAYATYALVLSICVFFPIKKADYNQ